MMAGPDYPPFRPRRPWLGGDLQTLRNVVLGRRTSLAPWPGRRLHADLPDGDRLFAMLHEPQEQSRRPTITLLHGLSGGEGSLSIRAGSAFFLARGWRVIRLNLRGAGPSAPACRGFYHAGRSEDLRAFLAWLAAEEPALARHGVFPMGFSLGGNLVLKFLAEKDFPVVVPGGVSVSAPIDLQDAWRSIQRPRNALYHRYLLQNLRREIRQRPLDLNGQFLRRVLGARSIHHFDELWTAPLNGFESADDYYARCSTLALLPEITVPTLAIH